MPSSAVTLTVAVVDARPPQPVTLKVIVVAPTETPESAAFLVIDEMPPDAGPKTKPERIFSGWMFASSPALSALENPVYDVSVLDCKEDAAPTPSVTPGSGLRKLDN